MNASTPASPPRPGTATRWTPVLLALGLWIGCDRSDKPRAPVASPPSDVAAPSDDAEAPAAPSEPPAPSDPPEPSGTPEPQPEGAPCSVGSDCASGVCEGEGCEPDEGRCAPAERMCTRDYRAYCGCDGKTFHGSGSCPGARFDARGPCPGADTP